MPRAPSPGTVIALAALMVALGGTGYAATRLAANSVGSPQLKPGAVQTRDIAPRAVTGVKIARNAVTGAKIRDGSITAADIAVGTLPTVPRAAAADATARVTVLPLTRAAPTDGANVAAARAAAPEVPLATRGQLSLYGKCFRNTTTNAVTAEIFVKTAADGAILSSRVASLEGDGGGANFMNIATPEVDRRVEAQTAAVNDAQFTPQNSSDVSAVAPDGTALRAFTLAAAKAGALAPSQGVYGAGDVCLFGGYVMG